jgi:hypothetical protein
MHVAGPAGDATLGGGKVMSLTASPQPASAGGLAARRRTLSEPMFWFMLGVVAVQGGHVVEHVVQLLQVTVFGVPDDRALGLLGYLIQFNGTEEWLHLGYNAVYLVSLYVLVVPLWRITPAVLPRLAFAAFLAASVWLETWHMVEHGVIISHVIANGGCPCPGIGDAALGVSDTILHFVYNVLAYAGIVIAFAYVVRDRGFVVRPRGDRRRRAAFRLPGHHPRLRGR